MKPNFQRLLLMAQRAEHHTVEMNHIFKGDHEHPLPSHTCGTIGCLIGTDYAYRIENCEDISACTYYKESDLIYYGLTNNEYGWLFDVIPLGLLLNPAVTSIRIRRLKTTSSEQAIGRLRKFIYYHMKKAELHEAWIETNKCHKRGLEFRNPYTPKSLVAAV